MKKSLFLLASLLLGGNLFAEVKLPPLLCDNMVLQQRSEANLWGEAAPSRTVSVYTSWDGGKQTVQADASGAWKLSVKTPEAGGPYTIRISDGSAPVVLKNVLIGEVWICSGQSNMEIPMGGFTGQPITGSLEAMLTGTNPSIRLFIVKNDTCSEPRNVFESAKGWEVTTPESIRGFSATGYFFARYLQEALNIPVGIIESDWSGTRIEAWMSPEAVRKTDLETGSSDDQSKHTGPNRLSVLYNAMILPIAHYTARGFLWYQGEGNIDNSPRYASLMKQMVALWRTKWGAEQMPFYFAQIAPFKYFARTNPCGVPLLVEQQLIAQQNIPYSGVAGTTDVGEKDCIHPSRKREVGQRLALLALVKTYGIKGLSCESPRYKSARFEEGKAIVSLVSDASLGPNYTPAEGFEIAGEDRKFYPATVKHLPIDPQAGAATFNLEISAPQVSRPVAVRYAFHNLPVAATLTNTFGLPAFPFRTDNWDDIH